MYRERERREREGVFKWRHFREGSKLSSAWMSEGRESTWIRQLFGWWTWHGKCCFFVTLSQTSLSSISLSLSYFLTLFFTLKIFVSFLSLKHFPHLQILTTSLLLFLCVPSSIRHNLMTFFKKKHVKNMKKKKQYNMLRHRKQSQGRNSLYQQVEKVTLKTCQLSLPSLSLFLLEKVFSLFFFFHFSQSVIFLRSANESIDGERGRAGSRNAARSHPTISLSFFLSFSLCQFSFSLFLFSTHTMR